MGSNQMASCDNPFVMHGSMADGLVEVDTGWVRRALRAEAYSAYFRAALIEIAEGVPQAQEHATKALANAKPVVEGF